MRWFTVLLCGCFFQSPVVHFGSGKSHEEAEQAGLTSLMPAQLATEPRYAGEARTMKIRVWADDDFRAQNIHWEKTFGDVLADANEVLGGVFGLRLEADYRTWNHHEPGNTLETDLDELARLDAGDGVMTVVGLTSALALVSADFELLGVANQPGKYIMLRGFADRAEREQFAAAFRDIPDDERESVVEARRRHKTTALFLHELGHNLGAPHEDGDTLMNHSYTHHAAAFSDGARDIIQRTLDQRLGRKHDAPASASKPDAPKLDSAHAQLVITIDASNHTIVGGNVIDAQTLDELFGVTFADDPDTQVVIKAERSASHGAVVRVMERAKAAGLTHLAFGSL